MLAPPNTSLLGQQIMWTNTNINMSTSVWIDFENFAVEVKATQDKRGLTSPFGQPTGFQITARSLQVKFTVISNEVARLFPFKLNEQKKNVNFRLLLGIFQRTNINYMPIMCQVRPNQMHDFLQCSLLWWGRLTHRDPLSIVKAICDLSNLKEKDQCTQK